MQLVKLEKMKRIGEKVKWFVCLFLLVGVACSSPKPAPQGNDAIYEGIEFDMPKVLEPVFQDYTVLITDFGAVGDGQVLNTQAFASAIEAVVAKGGGQVRVPRGIWLTGPIGLKSNINLHLEAGALVLFSPNKDLYPLVETSFEGLNTVRCQSPVYGRNLENIAITGDGILDGSGDAWRFVKRSKMTDGQWKKLVESGGVVGNDGKSWYPSEQFIKGEQLSGMNVPEGLSKMEDFRAIRDFLRPVMVSLINCNKVLLDGPVFQNSPAWNIHPLMCENLTVRNIDVRNPWYSQNGDGIDIESCKNTVVYNSTFDVGDDAICVKSGKDQDGRDRGIPNENLIIKNCVVYHGHGGVTVGSEMSGGVKNMHVSNCTFIGTDVGLRFKSTRGRGGVVEGIYISNIDMIDIPTNAISFNLYYGGLSVSEMIESAQNNTGASELMPVTEETPQFKDISIKDVRCKGALQAIYLQGLPEMNLENVYLENLTMEAENGLFCMDADGVVIKDLHLKTTVFPALNFYNVKNMSISGLDIPSRDEAMISVKGEKSEQLEIAIRGAVDLAKVLEVGQQVNPDQVKLVNMK